MTNVLIISRLPTDRSLLAAAAGRAGLRAVGVPDVVDAVIAIIEQRPELVLIGDEHPGVDLGRFLALLAKEFPETRRVLVSEGGKAKVKAPGSAINFELALPASAADIASVAARLRAAVE